MDSTHFNLIVLGFGKAGKTIAMERAQAGDDVALVERDPGMYGGTCINIACVPTKTLISATARGQDWGQAVTTRDELIDALNATNLQLAEDASVTVVDGEARFSGEREVTVAAPDSEDAVLTAEKVVINTGAVVNRPDLPGVDGPKIHDFVSLQHVSPRPDRLAVIGGGPVGLEFAGLFAAQGSRVTVVDSHERVLPMIDEDVASLAAEALREQGVSFLHDARGQAFTDVGDAVTVTYRQDDADHAVTVDAVLLALGRSPATEGLNLAAAGVETGEKGEVVVDEKLRTSAENVWAVGDVTGGPQQTYVSYDDYRVLSDQFSGDGDRTTEGRLLPTTTFLTPPLSTIGMGEDQARDAGYDVEVKFSEVADMPIVPRPKIVGQPEGAAKFIVDAGTDEILGATLFCVDSQELINTVAVAMRHGVTASELGRGIYTHPSTSEIFNQLLE